MAEERVSSSGRIPSRYAPKSYGPRQEQNALINDGHGGHWRARRLNVFGRSSESNDVTAKPMDNGGHFPIRTISLRALPIALQSRDVQSARPGDVT